MHSPLQGVAVLLGLIPSLAISSATPLTKAIFLFKDILQSNTTALRTSGFNTLIIFRIGVLANGDLFSAFTGSAGEAVETPVVTNGSYVGGPDLADKVHSFKTGTTEIERVEIALVSADDTFENIRHLVLADGTGSETVLYRNFAALKEAWDLDGIDNDDEGVYDVSSTVAFGTMLGTMGYKYSAAPYTNVNFWVEVQDELKAAMPGLFDRVYLQTYDGGTGNDPGDWQILLDMKITPIVWVVNDYKPDQGSTVDQALDKLSEWYEEYETDGGGYWNDYDIERMNSSYAAYGGVLTSVFG